MGFWNRERGLGGWIEINGNRIIIQEQDLAKALFGWNRRVETDISNVKASTIWETLRLETPQGTISIDFDDFGDAGRIARKINSRR